LPAISDQSHEILYLLKVFRQALLSACTKTNVVIKLCRSLGGRLGRRRSPPPSSFHHRPPPELDASGPTDGKDGGGQDFFSLLLPLLSPGGALELYSWASGGIPDLCSRIRRPLSRIRSVSAQIRVGVVGSSYSGVVVRCGGAGGVFWPPRTTTCGGGARWCGSSLAMPRWRGRPRLGWVCPTGAGWRRPGVSTPTVP
jgi:hypothetical protein